MIFTDFSCENVEFGQNFKGLNSSTNQWSSVLCLLGLDASGLAEHFLVRCAMEQLGSSEAAFEIYLYDPVESKMLCEIVACGSPSLVSELAIHCACILLKL